MPKTSKKSHDFLKRNRGFLNKLPKINLNNHCKRGFVQQRTG
ncbi:hypothetical protein LMIV_0294 [Listeria monocytogenes FSL J1-208]|nr:hypothetical protein LMIV_0294 [Listeria monocytogenes FSL J1-208]